MVVPVSMHVLCVRIVTFGLVFKFKKESMDYQEVVASQR